MSAEKILLLNFDYMPLRVISWQRAMKLWAKDKIEIVEEYEDVDIRTVSMSMKLPAVVRLRNYVKFFRKNPVKFSPAGVFHRDNFTCQYCNSQPGVRNLTMDHVVPRSRGGRTNWTNIVTACHPCNSKKADNMLENLRDMKLRKAPQVPNPTDYLNFRLIVPKTPEAWKNYMYWNSSID